MTNGSSMALTPPPNQVSLNEADDDQLPLGSQSDAGQPMADERTEDAIPHSMSQGAELAPAFPDTEALAKARSLAEKYKPKTPSGLRAARRYSSSPLIKSSPMALSKEADEAELVELFGDDEFGREAYELYKCCPSGDLRKMEFPDYEPLADPRVAEGIDNMMSEGDIKFGYNAFCEAFDEFQKTLDLDLDLAGTEEEEL
jgi:hypothetical protein